MLNNINRSPFYSIHIFVNNLVWHDNKHIVLLELLHYFNDFHAFTRVLFLPSGEVHFLFGPLYSVMD